MAPRSRLKTILIGEYLLAFSAAASGNINPSAFAETSRPIWHGSRNLPAVALTFDDGPKQEHCQAILDILDRYKIKATFFVVGQEVEKNPDLIDRIHHSGHEIGNHTYAHNALDTVTDTQARLELQALNDILFQMTGTTPAYFRPPGGRYNTQTLALAHKLGLQAVMWDVNARDYTPFSPSLDTPSGSPEESLALVRRVTESVQNGSIVLFHNGGKDTITALPLIIEQLIKDGYSFVTIGKLVNAARSKPPEILPATHRKEVL